MTTTVWTTERVDLNSASGTALKAAVRFWSAVILLGQLLFAFEVASFYGMAALRGASARAWSKHVTHGYVPGDFLGNFVVFMHIASAPIIILAGLIQLFPQIRERAPWLHRWNGRLYIMTAFTISLAGLYMTWIRGSVGDLSQHIGSTLMAVLILLFAGMAFRYALKRDFKTHRRWALRLYLVVSASLFIRAGIFLSFVLNKGPFGFDPATFSGPFLTFMSFAQYLIPLAVLEIYLRVKDRGRVSRQFAMAAGLFVLTIGMAVGISVVTMVVFVPSIKKAFDGRKSIEATLSTTMASGGVDAAIAQYRALKAGAPSAYNFEEGELNTLGYELIHAKKVKEAVRIFQLNVDAYPKSSNTYDSLGEAYLDDGNRPLAITNFRRAITLNPKNYSAIGWLRKLNAPKSARLIQ